MVRALKDVGGQPRYSEFPFVGLQDHLQLTGALQKIAICYLAAFLIYLWAGLRGAIGSTMWFAT